MKSGAVSAAAMLLALLALLGCASTPQGAGEADPGSSKAAAIEVCRPSGQRDYLALLRCEDGSTPAYKRIGSFGPRHEPPASMSDSERLAFVMQGYKPLKPGQRDHHIVDQYELVCGTQPPRFVFMDMYHCDKPSPARAPRGFSLVPPRP